MRILIPLLMVILSFNASNAIQLSDTSFEGFVQSSYGKGWHPGEFCATCHYRFSQNRPYANELPYPVKNDALTTVSGCRGKFVCHRSNPNLPPHRRVTRRSHGHICDNCHMKTNKTNGSYAIHDIHLKFQDLSLNRSSEYLSCNAPGLQF
jgi:hypothetical protein